MAISIEEAVSQLSGLQSKLNGMASDFVNALALQGYEVARTEFAGASYAGINDVSVSVEYESGSIAKATVIAEGSAVLFIEFGTGITKVDNYEERAIAESSALVGHGQYGRGRGANPKGWAYTGNLGANPPSDTYQLKSGVVRTMGNDATPAMYNARKKAKDGAVIADAFKQSFGDLLK